MTVVRDKFSWAFLPRDVPSCKSGCRATLRLQDTSFVADWRQGDLDFRDNEDERNLTTVMQHVPETQILLSVDGEDRFYSAQNAGFHQRWSGC